MKDKRKLTNFLADRIANELDLEHIPYDLILGLLVEFEEELEGNDVNSEVSE